MQSFKRLARASLSILLLLLLGVVPSACVQAPAVFLTANTCSELVPEDWSGKGISSASLPPEDTVGAWIAFADAQTGQLDKANAQTRDAMAIVKKCEALQQKAADALKPKPWWKLW